MISMYVFFLDYISMYIFMVSSPFQDLCLWNFLNVVLRVLILP